MTDALTPLSQRIAPKVICEALLGGMTLVRGTKSSAHIIVASPGKVTEALTKKYVKLSSVRTFVLDEADYIIANTEVGRSMAKDTNDIMGHLPASCQLMFFSATYTPEIFEKAREMVPKAVTFKLASDDELMMEKIYKVALDVRGMGRLGALQMLYRLLPMQQSIVFVERRAEADRIAQMMNAAGLQVSTLHSDLKGPERDIAMQQFRDQETRVLITTNVLARGVDVPSVAVVINYDLPLAHAAVGGFNRGKATPDYTTFVHRIGRTGRAERRGTAISFLESEEDFRIMAAIDHYYSPHKSMMHPWKADAIPDLCADIIRRQAEKAE